MSTTGAEATDLTISLQLKVDRLREWVYLPIPFAENQSLMGIEKQRLGDEQYMYN